MLALDCAMEKCDSFWQWGNARKTFSFGKIGSAGSGSCPVRDETSSVVGGSCLNMLNEGGLLKKRKCMGPAFVLRSHIISEGNVSKSGGPCRYLYLPVQCSTVEVDLSSSDCKNGQPNYSESPTTVLQVPNNSSLSDTSSTDFDAISCRPHGYLSPQLQFLPYSDGNLLHDGNFCDPSKFRALKRGQRAAPDNDYVFSTDGIHNSCAGFSREASTEASPSCSESENLKLQLWGMKEEIRNLRAVGALEASLSYMEKPKRGHSMISDRSSEIQKENSESFAALHLLADMAVWLLENIYIGGDHKAKTSSAQWAIFHPTGVPFCRKRVIRKAKSAFKSLSQLHGNADKNVAANSEHLSGSLEFIEPSENQVLAGRISDTDHGATQSVRSSKRTRSQFLNSKYCDSVLQPMKKG
ncbi:hypothetical protein SUGI_0634070 [Cryptomeria japonica]|nr:hypothetical protein SUGI_0634070 [Cryptomeria japonica]